MMQALGEYRDGPLVQMDVRHRNQNVTKTTQTSLTQVPPVETELLPYLDTFCKAAELLSFTATAETLNVTQATISQRIQALEKMVNNSLFLRTSGRVVLTEAGHKLYSYAQQILALHRQALDELREQTTVIQGELMIAASSIPGEYLLPPLLTAFLQKHPRVKVRVSVTDSKVVLDQIRSGEAHFGLVGQKVEDPNLRWQAFARDELVVAVSVKHRWKDRDTITLQELAQEPLIIRESGSGSRGRLEQALRDTEHSLRDWSVLLELGSNHSIKEALLQGTGVTVLSRLALQKEINEGVLHVLKINNLNLTRELFVVHDHRRAMSAPARLFLQLLREEREATDEIR